MHGLHNHLIDSLLVGADWNHGMDYDFPFSWEWKIIPTDELTPSFFRGVGIPPTKLPSGDLTYTAMENGPFIDGLPIKNGDFPWLC